MQGPSTAAGDPAVGHSGGVRRPAPNDLRWHAGTVGLIAVGLGALLVLLPITRSQCRTWRNSETLWTHVLTHGGSSSYVPHNNLGLVLSDQGNDAAAAAHFTEALRLKPDYFDTHNSLGIVLAKQGNDNAAAAHFTEALRLNPDCFDAHNNLGTILSRQKRYAEAERHFAQAVRINPGYVKAHYNLGLLQAEQGHYDAAAAHYSDVLRLDPASADAHKDLGQILKLQSKVDAAATHLTEALRLNPGYGDAHISLGTILSRERRYAEALSHFAEAIRLRPDDPNAYNESAMMMAACPDAKLRDGKKAVQLATRACELTQWKDPRPLDTLAAAQAEAGDYGAAVNSQQRAIELLTDEQQKADYRSRLALYQAKRTYRDVSPELAPALPRP